MSATAFYPLKIAEVRRETSDSVSLRLDVPDALRDRVAFRAGQHLTLRRDLGGEDIRRNYSLCVAPHEGEWRIAVKQIAGGGFSSFATAERKAGDVVEAKVPRGSCTWSCDP